MPVSTFDVTAPISLLLDSNGLSLATTQAHPLTAPYAPGFEAMHTKLLAVHAEEIHLGMAVHKASARVTMLNDDLNGLVDILSRTVLNATKGRRETQLYKLYFDSMRPSDIKKPLLGSKLERARDWAALLPGSPLPALSALAAEVAAKVNEADEAVTALAQAKLALKEFRTVGARKMLVDEINALRKSVHGLISELPHKHPEKNLPRSFAERFFSHEEARKSRTKEQPRSREALTARIAQHEEELDDLRQELKAKIAEEAEAAKAIAQQKALVAELASAEKVAEEALAKVAAMKAKLATGGQPTAAAEPAGHLARHAHEGATDSHSRATRDIGRSEHRAEGQRAKGETTGQ